MSLKKKLSSISPVLGTFTMQDLLIQLPSGPRVTQIRVMQAPQKGVDPFSSDDWLYEVKFDGYRALAGFGQGQPTQLRTKQGMDCTKWFPEVCEALASIPGGPHVVDAEACILDDLGRSDFDRLQARASRQRYVPGTLVTLCAFDLLVENGESVMHLPLVMRKERLASLLAGVPKRAVLYVSDLPADKALFRSVVHELKLEGFMAKRKSSTYQQGERSRDWLKIKRKGAVLPGRFSRKGWD